MVSLGALDLALIGLRAVRTTLVRTPVSVAIALRILLSGLQPLRGPLDFLLVLQVGFAAVLLPLCSCSCSS